MTTIHHVRSAEDALKLLAGAKRVLFHCRLDGHVGDEPMAYISNFWSAGLRVGVNDAKQFVKDVFDGREARREKPFLRMSVRMETPMPMWDKRQCGPVQGKDVKVVWIG